MPSFCAIACTQPLGAPPRPRQVMADSQPGAGGEQRPFYDFLEGCLRHKSGACQALPG